MSKKATMKSKEREAAIEKNMKVLGISREEAEELWAFDHDEVDNQEVAAIEQSISDVKAEKKARKGSPLDKVKLMKAKKKADRNKTEIINAVWTFIEGMAVEGLFIAPQEMTSGKMSFMDKDGGFYSLTITKHKTQPDGYRMPQVSDEAAAAKE